MNDTDYLIPSQHLFSELIDCAAINLCHSDLFPSQTELKVIGHHQTYVRPKLKRSDGPVKDILRPVTSVPNFFVHMHVQLIIFCPVA